MRRLLLYCCAAAGLAACCGAAGAGAQACSLDQRPSMSANNLLARLNTQTPTTRAQLATWSYFVFSHGFPAHHSILLSENRREVARTLTAAAMRQPWGWQFGDGQVAYGTTVRHAYARPGHWPIKVYVWDPQSSRWDLFDEATITIT